MRPRTITSEKNMLKEKYEKEVVPELIKIFDYKNKMAAPLIEKVVVNTGFGKKIKDLSGKKEEEFLSLIEDDIALITGQKPVMTRSRKAISGFSLRKGEVVGAKVTLRGKRMYDFLERLIHVALPRSRDFRGLDRNSIDQAGNLTIGVKEQMIFPEVDTETLKDSFGFQVIVKTNTKDREEAIKLFELLGFPVKKQQ